MNNKLSYFVNNDINKYCCGLFSYLGFYNDLSNSIPCLQGRGGVQSKKAAFTLAEVLITIAIIGVVAAMTMPAIIQHHKRQETSAKLKKFYSTMEQAIRMSEMENEDSKNWTKPSTAYANGSYDGDKNGEITKDFFTTYLAPYFKYTEIVEGKSYIDEEGTKKNNQTTVYLSDGTSFSIMNGGCLDIGFDVNGDKLPNTYGKDRYAFLMCFSEGYRNYHCGSNQRIFCGYGTQLNGTVQDIRAKRLADCAKSGYWCSGLLLLDNFEFKSDYPYRL